MKSYLVIRNVKNMYHSGLNFLFDCYLTDGKAFFIYIYILCLFLIIYTKYRLFLFDCYLTKKENITIYLGITKKYMKIIKIVVIAKVK